MRKILFTKYHEKMGKLIFPAGFEAHLKSLMPEYDDREVYVRDDNGKYIKKYTDYSCRRKADIIEKQMRCYGWSDDLKNPVEWDDPRLTSQTPDCALQRRIHPVASICGEIKRDVFEGYEIINSLEIAKYRTETDWKALRLIIRDNMMVGVALSEDCLYIGENIEYIRGQYILPYSRYIYYSASDNNGAGYKERNWYRYLVCLPYNHNLW